MRFPLRFLLVIMTLVSCLSLIAACATTQLKNPNVPNKERLNARIASFHDALGNNDIESWYKMTSPEIREKMTFEQFKKGMRWDENSERRIKETTEGKLLKVCNCSEMRFLRCVVVADVSTLQSDGQLLKEKPLESWEFANGEWYWAYIGPDSRGRCPGE